MDKDQFNKDLGAQLRAMRKAKHVKREEIAEFFHVGKDYIGKIERGESPLSAHRLTEWVLFLGGVLTIGGQKTVQNTLTVEQKKPEE